MSASAAGHAAQGLFDGPAHRNTLGRRNRAQFTLHQKPLPCGPTLNTTAVLLAPLPLGFTYDNDAASYSLL